MIAGPGPTAPDTIAISISKNLAIRRVTVGATSAGGELSRESESERWVRLARPLARLWCTVGVRIRRCARIRGVCRNALWTTIVVRVVRAIGKTPAKQRASSKERLFRVAVMIPTPVLRATTAVAAAAGCTAAPQVKGQTDRRMQGAR